MNSNKYLLLPCLAPWSVAHPEGWAFVFRTRGLVLSSGVVFVLSCAACSTPPQPEAETPGIETSAPKDEVLQAAPADTLETAPAIQTTTLTSKPRIRPPEPEEQLSTVELMTNDQPDIRPGYTHCNYALHGEHISFRRMAKHDEDLRVGCSGGSDELTFSVPALADSFRISGAQLQEISFVYHVEGGLYDLHGTKPHDGYISGKRADDQSWHIELDLWVEMIDTHNETVQRQLQLSDRFLH